MKITKELGTLDFRKRPHSFTGNTYFEEVSPTPGGQQKDHVLRS